MVILNCVADRGPSFALHFCVVLLSGYFGCKQRREFFDAEVLPNLREPEVAAFEDEVTERIGR